MALSRFESLWKFMINIDFEIDDTISENFKCVICKKLLIEPFVAECGCHYCMQCITKYLCDNSKHCPGTKAFCKQLELELETNVLRDFTTQFHLIKIAVKCPNELCDIKLQLEKMEEHVRMCSMRPLNCPYEIIGCAARGTTVANIDAHIQSDMFNHSQIMMEAINNLRNDLDHVRLQGEVERSEIGQQRSELNVLKNGVEENKNVIGISNGVLEEEKREIDMLIGELEAKNREIERLKEECEENSELIREIKGENSVMKEELALLQQFDAKRLCDIGETKEDCVELKSKITILEKDINRLNSGGDLKAELNKQNKEIENIKSDMNRFYGKIEEINKSMKKIVIEAKYDFVWTIEDILNKRNWFQSEAFYKDNYKMCLKGWIGGLFGDYFKLYFCLMKGDKDNLAMWPMSEFVTLVILNQDTDLGQVSWRCCYEGYRGDKSVFDRPKNNVNEYIDGPWMYMKDIRNTEGLLSGGTLKVSCVLHPSNVN